MINGIMNNIPNKIVIAIFALLVLSIIGKAAIITNEVVIIGKVAIITNEVAIIGKVAIITNEIVIIIIIIH